MSLLLNQQEGPSGPSFYRHVAVSLGLALLVFIVYSGALKGGFVFDDLMKIGGVPHTEGFGGWLDFRNRPLMNFIDKLDFLSQQPADPFYYHRTNVAIHAVNAMLVYSILASIVPSGAIVGAALFAIHPFFSNGAIYITARSSTLASMFMWTGILALLHLRGVFKWLAMGISMILSCFAKEDGLLILPLLVAFYWTSREIDRRLALRILVIAIVFVALGLPLIPHGHFVRLNEMIYTSDDLKSTHMIPFITGKQHIQATLFDFALHDMWNIFAIPWSLSAEPPLTYDHWSLTLAAILVVLGLFVTFFSKRVPIPLRYAAAALLISPVPVCIFLAMGDLNFEYRAYSCGLGFALVMAWIYSKLPNLGRIALAAAFSALFIPLTVHQIAIWKTPVTLWSYSTKQNPSIRGWTNLGYGYQLERQPQEAVKAYLAALTIRPDLPVTLTNLASAYMQMGQFLMAQKVLEAAIQLAPNRVEPMENYSTLLMVMNQPNLALPMSNKVITMNPNSLVGHQNRGAALAALGQKDAAEVEWHQVERLQASR